MITWLKKNWLTFLLVFIIVLLLKGKTSTPFFSSRTTTYPESNYDSIGSASGFAKMSAPMASLSLPNVAPSDSADRLVIQDTSLSLQVQNVESSVNQIETLAKGLGGFLVDSDISKPEFAATGHITVRIPEDKRTEALAAFKNLAVKVVSEHVNGTDVTDQYVDLQARLDVLNQTKTKFQEILNRAENVSSGTNLINDILSVQRELINIQDQIDRLKGQQKYYEQSAKLSKVTIYLSTDDLSLPYSPDQSWRPAVIFKQAVRSLVGSLRSIGTLLIWSTVYSIIIIPVLGIIYLLKRRKHSR
jgi:hypothetical protein